MTILSKEIMKRIRGTDTDPIVELNFYDSYQADRATVPTDP